MTAQIFDSPVPFREIVGISPFNVRQSDEADDISGLKATIDAVGLIDAVLDAEGIAAYLLYECDRGPGKIIMPGGQEYPIATVEDVEKLLAEQYPIEGNGHG